MGTVTVHYQLLVLFFIVLIGFELVLDALRDFFLQNMVGASNRFIDIEGYWGRRSRVHVVSRLIERLVLQPLVRREANGTVPEMLLVHLVRRLDQPDRVRVRH